MKRLIVVVIAAAIVAFAVSRLVRRLSQGDGATVLRLLPKETLAMAVMPDLTRTRAQWRQTDVYKLWHEPALQDFLQRPLSASARASETPRIVDEIERLDASNLFAAVLAIENSAWQIGGGFQFDAPQQEAEMIVERWRRSFFGSGNEAKRETIEYRGHQITATSLGIVQIASAFDGKWFFAANNVDTLKLLLDRADGQNGSSGALVEEPSFIAARHQLPGAYASLVYARVGALVDAVAADVPNASAAAEALRQLRAFAAALWFEGGKIRDRSVALMPKGAEGDLERRAEVLGTKETWLYLCGLSDLTAALFPTNPGGATGVVQPVAAALQQSDISAEEWKAAFTNEVDILADWPSGTRWPTLLASIPVRDAGRARDVSRKLSQGAATSGWTASERNGVSYFEIPAGMEMLAIEPTLAISDKFLIAGLGAESVEGAVSRATKGGGLGVVAQFKEAEALVSRPRQSFGYVDTAQLYTRLDAALRPVLVMGAAFVPAIRDAVDLSKLPPPETITKHLSPIVMSQSYSGDGYVTESVGPITFTQLVVASATLGIVGPSIYRQQAGLVAPLSSMPIPALPHSTATPPPAKTPP